MALHLQRQKSRRVAPWEKARTRTGANQNQRVRDSIQFLLQNIGNLRLLQREFAKRPGSDGGPKLSPTLIGVPGASERAPGHSDGCNSGAHTTTSTPIIKYIQTT